MKNYVLASLLGLFALTAHADSRNGCGEAELAISAPTAVGVSDGIIVIKALDADGEPLAYREVNLLFEGPAQYQYRCASTDARGMANCVWSASARGIVRVYLVAPRPDALGSGVVGVN